MSIFDKLIDKISPINEQASEGEAFISDYLKFKKIKFEKQVEITTLTGDTKSKRIADFYLPRYKIYIEFLGQWNKDDESKRRYNEKKIIYQRNQIPCVYLYPENLGIIEHTLDYRVKRELKLYKRKRELFYYRSYQFWDDFSDNILLIGLMVLVAIFNWYENIHVNLYYLTVAIITFQLYLLRKGYRKYFINDFN